MKEKTFHKLLKKQIKRTLKDQAEDLPANFIKLLDTVSDSYTHFERDRKLLERAMELSSEEIRASYEQKIIQRELKKTNDSLQQFVSIASHDLKSPLRTVNSFTQLLQRELGNDLTPEIEEYLGFIVSGVKGMQNLLDDLSNYAKMGMENKELEIVDFNKILETVQKNLGYAIEDTNAKITTKDTLPVCFAHTYQVIQLFQNIISNALKFRKKEVTPEIVITCQRGEDFFRISIADNGIGMDEKQQSKAFEAFTRLSYQTDVQGSGLGLSICKKIVEGWEGKIYFESELGKGTSIIFTIPIQKETAELISGKITASQATK